ncbi:unnamed protein product [Sphagnum jensenii]
MLSRGAFHEIVLGGLQESLVAALAGGRNSHDLEPSTYQQPIVKDQPGKRPHLAWVGVVPHSGDDLGDCRVAEVQMLDESDDAGSVLLPPCISSERCSMALLNEHFDRLVPFKRDDDIM